MYLYHKFIGNNNIRTEIGQGNCIWNVSFLIPPLRGAAGGVYLIVSIRERVWSTRYMRQMCFRMIRR